MKKNTEMRLHQPLPKLQSAAAKIHLLFHTIRFNLNLYCLLGRLTVESVRFDRLCANCGSNGLVCPQNDAVKLLIPAKLLEVPSLSLAAPLFIITLMTSKLLISTTGSNNELFYTLL